MSYSEIRTEEYKGSIDVKKLASNINANFDVYPYTVSVSGVDGENGTNVVTLQAQNANGDSLAGRSVLRVWLSGSSYGAPSATGITAFAVGTGVELEEVVNLANYRILTDANGTAVFTVTAANGTYHVMVEAAGVASTGTAVITGN